MRQDEVRHLPAKIGAVDQLHCEIRPAFMVPDFMNGNDVRMVQVSGGLGFKLESLDGSFGGKLSFDQQLESDETV
jgi:hypothetical protein